MCQEWQADFSKFLADMGRCPDGYSLDRIDNDGPYTPDNCRWATRSEQQNNKRTNRLLTFHGLTKTAAQWAQLIRIPAQTILYRIDVKKWPIDKALKTS